MRGSGNSPAIAHELIPAPEPEETFSKLCALPHCLFLDSALCHPKLGRYSFLAADPFDYFEIPADGSDGLGLLAGRIRPFVSETFPDLPPFQGGAAGVFSYDLNHSLEKLPRPAWDEFAAPALAVGLYDVVLAMDRVQGRAWLISQGFPETEPAARRERAAARLHKFLGWLEGPGGDPTALRRETKVEPLRREQLAPQFSTSVARQLSSSFSSRAYCAAIQRAIDYIHAGDIFQVNLAQRLLFPARDDAVALYTRLRRCNPATFAGYFDLGAFQIVSASPERFLHVRGKHVEARPIKGTRRRISRGEADLYVGDELKQSEKDRAENVMIVDLLRNDLSRVCRPESVRVTQLCDVETYEYVQHLVSAVRGELEDGCSPLDLLRASFPGGSITGAPKVRAMEIVAELEPTARGPYCGSLGYLGFDGALDLSILIRTVTAGRGWWQLPVGGGIVAQSIPGREYEETWHKAAGMLPALE